MYTALIRFSREKVQKVLWIKRNSACGRQNRYMFVTGAKLCRCSVNGLQGIQSKSCTFLPMFYRRLDSAKQIYECYANETPSHFWHAFKKFERLIRTQGCMYSFYKKLTIQARTGSFLKSLRFCALLNISKKSVSKHFQCLDINMLEFLNSSAI